MALRPLKQFIVILLLDLLLYKHMQRLTDMPLLTKILSYSVRYLSVTEQGKSSDIHPSKRRKNTGSKKCKCQMRVYLLKDRASTEVQWKLKVLEAIYNHAASADSIAHLAHRITSITAETRVAISSLAKAGISNAQILSALREEAPGASISLLSKDISNLVQTERKRELGGKTPIQWLIEVYTQDAEGEDDFDDFT
ncbi:uncharacterized protein RSE6_14806 [Rhynchosporium secalis]|uniref:Transposase n=1 Tax=Rhynchosporium secalis TaxID=38038 RepID=A0A1E1MW80_RHYSE|nr:uncharacterized protein RSE6_14806 [Rhynchosporium secalis]